MPKREDIKRIMVVGSGPVVIGQAAEFDYSGVQACKVLLEEGYEVVLVNSNPATIMTDPEFATRTYVEPLLPGPVAAIIRAMSVDEAVRIANESDFGLSSAVFSRDINAAMAVASRIESGICHINGPTVHDEAQMPFGGVKASGYGRFGGNWGIAEFTELRWITIQNGPMHYPL